MAYIDQDKKKELAPRIKHVLKKHGMKGTLSIDNYSSNLSEQLEKILRCISIIHL